MLEKSLLKEIKELHAKIDSQDATIATLFDAQTGGAESKLLRGELKKAFEKIRNLEKENQQHRDEIKKMRRKIVYYESENMSTLTTSNYNDARRKFREKRGENPKGGPGEKISKAVEDADNNGKDDGTRGPNGKKIGPPIGHTGVSHHKSHPSTVALSFGYKSMCMLQKASC